MLFDLANPPNIRIISLEQNVSLNAPAGLASLSTDQSILEEAFTMFTSGGSHSEVEIPEILDHLRPQYPGVELRYAWPFDLKLVANTLTEQVQRVS